jgi:hypothetical protein
MTRKEPHPKSQGHTSPLQPVRSEAAGRASVPSTAASSGTRPAHIPSALLCSHQKSAPLTRRPAALPSGECIPVRPQAGAKKRASDACFRGSLA